MHDVFKNQGCKGTREKPGGKCVTGRGQKALVCRWCGGVGDGYEHHTWTEEWETSDDERYEYYAGITGDDY